MPQLWTDITNHAIPWKAVYRFARRWVAVNVACIGIFLLYAVILVLGQGSAVGGLGAMWGPILCYIVIKKIVDKRFSLDYVILAYILGITAAGIINGLIFKRPEEGITESIVAHFIFSKKPNGTLFPGIITGAVIGVFLILLQGRRIHPGLYRKAFLIISHILAFSGSQYLLNLLFHTPFTDFNTFFAILSLAFIWFNWMIGIGLAMIQQEIPPPLRLPFKLPDNLLGKILRRWKPLVFYPLLLIATYYLRNAIVNSILYLSDPPYQPPLVEAGHPFPIPDSPITAENAREVVPIARWSFRQNQDEHLYSDDLPGIKFSADSRSLWNCSVSDRKLRVWSVADGTFTTPPINCDLMDFNSNHQLLAVVYKESLHLYRSTDWSELLEIKAPVYHIGISPDGTLLATTGPEGKFLFYRTNDGAQIAELPPVYKIISHPDGTQTSEVLLSKAIALNADGTLLASVNITSEVQIWSLPDLQPAGTFSLNEGELIDSIAFNSQNTRLAAVTIQGKIYLGSLETGQWIRNIEGNLGSNNSIAFSPDGTLLAASSTSPSLTLWNVSSGRLMMEYDINELKGNSHAFDFSPDGKLIALRTNNSNDILILGIPKRD